MPKTSRHIGTFVSAVLLLTVISQIIYVATLSGVGIVEGWPLRSTIWTIELLLFTAIAIASFVGLVRSSEMQLGWSALAVAGLINMVQSGIGLSMFLPAAKAGEELAPLMGTVVAGSFLFYYLAKVVLGLAAVFFGLWLFRNVKGLGQIAGVVSLIAGMIAIALNVAAMRLGLGAVPLAGASGAIATFAAGCALWWSSRQAE
ncbi:thiamine biosynthesis protein ThiC [Parasphingorhabdus sp.]|uniref:thiamine biosynthesis protein ThiC n=1 Tax=Parasphingorhabdus sp. TaxID=2709688 RepID=UPI003D2D96C0